MYHGGYYFFFGRGHFDPFLILLLVGMYLLVYFDHVGFCLAYKSTMIPKAVSEKDIDRIAFSIGILAAGASTAIYFIYSDKATILSPVGILLFFILLRVMCNVLSTWLFGEAFDDE